MNSSDFENLPSSSVKLVFSGRVQGVGFRWTAARIARNYRVRGTVRNLSDGTVELCVGGSPEDTKAFLTELDRTMRENIERCDISELSEPLPAEGFQIIQ